MNKMVNDLNTNINIAASQNDIARLLNTQYGDMSIDEARAVLLRTNHDVWSNEELLETFEVSNFDPPYVNVIRKADGQRGAVAFINTPRLYFAFQPEETNDARPT